MLAFPKAVCLWRCALRFTCMLTVALLAACGGDAPQTTAVQPTVPVKRAATPEDPTAKMARAVTLGKSNVPVELKYEILSKPLVGMPVDLELAVIATQVADSITIAYTGTTGLTLSTDSAPTVDRVKAGHVEKLKLTVQAAAEAVHYVTVTVTLYVAGTTETRMFAVPLIFNAANATAKPEAAPAAPPAGTPPKA
jgi:hypothetical protein